jgi:hypothetical protein
MMLLVACGCIYGFWFSGEDSSIEVATEVTANIKTNQVVNQVYIPGWGNIPAQNRCPHCDGASYMRFCSYCQKERGNLPFIGVYCSKCNPDGNYASQTDDINKICGDCGSERSWKYIYKDWQTKPKPIAARTGDALEIINSGEGALDISWEDATYGELTIDPNDTRSDFVIADTGTDFLIIGSDIPIEIVYPNNITPYHALDYDPNASLINIADYDITSHADISFEIDDIEILFNVTDGKFDVVYDPNKCTESAEAFFVCLKEYFN